MNNICLIGHITKDPELTITSSQKHCLMFTIAVDREGSKDSNGNTICDWIPCVAWNGKADFIHQYVKKGYKLAIQGSMQSYTTTSPDGKKTTSYSVLVDLVTNLTPIQR